jgi:hypothetical protein
MLVQTRTKRGAILDHFDFDPDHPKNDTCVQQVARSKSQIATVIFNGQLIQFQTAKDSIPGGHPETNDITNDLAKIFLSLFIPWQQLSALFTQHAKQNIYS